MPGIPVDKMTDKQLDRYIMAGLPLPDLKYEWTSASRDLGDAMHCLERLTAVGRKPRYYVQLSDGWQDPTCLLIELPPGFDGIDPTVLLEYSGTRHYEQQDASWPLAIAKCVGKALKEEELRKESEADNV